jgi:hypothetical protein
MESPIDGAALLDRIDASGFLKLRPPFLLQKNECSRLHKFLEAATNGFVLHQYSGLLVSNINLPLLESAQPFVVKHDWWAAFKGADGFNEDPEFRLPYDICVFEFRINSKTYIAVTKESEWEDETFWNKLFILFSEHGKVWLDHDINHPECRDLHLFIWLQIKAICVSLEAEIATTEVVRAPSRLNEKRAKSGKPALRDYHVVDLAHRHRVASHSFGDSGTKKRLHFVRGHWRHYEERKTWIKWHLRGNPDLGFIQKHYAL